jgi:hypothetical protein
VSVGRANYNAMLAELKHQFSRQFMADVAVHLGQEHGRPALAPYSEPDYPYNPQPELRAVRLTTSGRSFKVLWHVATGVIPRRQ